MGDVFAAKIIRRFEELENDRATTNQTWQDIADHILGLRDFQVSRTRGENRMPRIYDTTARVAGQLLAGTLHALLTSPSAQWFRFAFEEPELNDIAEASRWLASAEARVFNAITRPESNFHAQASELYMELVQFGTGSMFVEDKVRERRVLFSTRPLQELYFAENASGMVDTVFRRFKLSARQAVERLGRMAPEKALKSAEKGVAEEQCEFLHAIMPNEDAFLGARGPRGMPWQSLFVSVDEGRVISTGGYREFPMAIARWQKEPWEVYGRGPGWSALPDAKGLNEMKRVLLKAGQRAVDPTYLVDNEGVLPTDLNFKPGGVVPVDAVNSRLDPPVQTLRYEGNTSVTQQLVGDTRSQVQDAYFHQIVSLIRDPNMTATQVLELSSQVQRHLASILGPLQTGFLEPMLERVWAIEDRAGRLPPPPEELVGRPIRIDYVSPIARSQKASDAQAIINAFTVATNLAQVDPTVLDVLDTDAGMREIAQALGVPPVVIRSQREIEIRREAAAQNAQEDQEAQQQLLAAEVAQKQASAMKDAAAAQGGGV